MKYTDNYFQNASYEKEEWFDEGPIIYTKPLSSSTLQGNDTSKIDPYRQGIEITQFKYFDAGSYKIHSGVPGHKKAKLNFGLNKKVEINKAYNDQHKLNPVSHILNQSFSTVITVITTVTSSYNYYSQQDTIPDSGIFNQQFDGVLEPLEIRKVVNFSSINVQEIHSVKGNICNGNLDHNNANDLIVTTYRYNDNSIIPYDDNIKKYKGIKNSTNKNYNNNNLYLYKDEVFFDSYKLINWDIRINQQVNLWDNDFITLLSNMSGSTDNYVPINHKSTSKGWYYDMSTPGTDSIAFGGMTY